MIQALQDCVNGTPPLPATHPQSWLCATSSNHNLSIRYDSEVNSDTSRYPQLMTPDTSLHHRSSPAVES